MLEGKIEFFSRERSRGRKQAYGQLTAFQPLCHKELNPPLFDPKIISQFESPGNDAGAPAEVAKGPLIWRQKYKFYSINSIS